MHSACPEIPRIPRAAARAFRVLRLNAAQLDLVPRNSWSIVSIMPGLTWRVNGHKALCPLTRWSLAPGVLA
eukprot:COSAG02_NODE_33885_length_492_cov_7.768448_1_plen_70_part_10